MKYVVWSADIAMPILWDPCADAILCDTSHAAAAGLASLAWCRGTSKKFPLFN